MPSGVDPAVLKVLSEGPLDWRFKGMPSAWWGRTPAQVIERREHLFDAGAVGPVCVLDAVAIEHNLSTMARWCDRHGVELAPHGKTHMSPQLLARQFDAGACAVTVANISQARVLRAFGVSDIILANELVDAAGLTWLADELDGDPNFNLVCWVDSVAGVQVMSTALAGSHRAVDVCVEIGVAGGRTGCRDATTADEVARAAAASPQLRLVGVAGYEAAAGGDVTADALARVRAYLGELRAAVVRLADVFQTDDIVATAGGSVHFDTVAEMLTNWPPGLAVRTIIRSGCYLTHDDGFYARSSPFGGGGLIPALSVWAQVMSRPEPDLALLTMGRRDVSFDHGLPVPYGLPDSHIAALDDQHAYLRLASRDQIDVQVGSWLRFGISHPCTVFDKWPLIPVLDHDHRVVEFIRTFF